MSIDEVNWIIKNAERNENKEVNAKVNVVIEEFLCESLVEGEKIKRKHKEEKVCEEIDGDL